MGNQELIYKEYMILLLSAAANYDVEMAQRIDAFRKQTLMVVSILLIVPMGKTLIMTNHLITTIVICMLTTIIRNFLLTMIFKI